MGPLFSAIVAGLVSAGVFVLVFCVGRFFWRPGKALKVAILFTLGSGIGVVIAAVISVPVVGIGSTLAESWQVIAYLTWLFVGGLLSGGLFVWWYVRRSNPSSQPTAFGGG
jgi:hypothetical protein